MSPYRKGLVTPSQVNFNSTAMKGGVSTIKGTLMKNKAA